MSRSALAFVTLLIGACLASTACESSSTNVLGPSGTKCGISLPTNVPTIAPAGGPGTLTVTVAPECVWKASSDAAWIAITENANGQGSGVVRFVASGNPTALMRRAAVIVGEARVELSQGGAPCQFTLTPATQTLGMDGGEGSVGVAVIDGCQWTATSTEPWLSVVGTSSGAGTGTVHYRADVNTGSTRSGTLKIADRTFVVNQTGTGTPCSVSIGQAEQSVTAAGGEDVVSVIAAAACPWSATSHAPWITVASGASGSGTGAVRLNIAPNAGGQRVGIVTVTGNTYAVTQAGAAGTCFYSIAAPGQSAPAAASTGSVAVSASSGCPWTALSQAPWITVASGNAGNGNGVVTLAIATNTGAARTGVVTVAGFSYTVTQDAAGTTPCTYAIDATELTAPSAGTTSAVRVTAPGGCSWTAASHVGWIAVTSGASGNGTGTVNITVAANAGSARTGAVTIAGHTYTVTQQPAASTPNPCSYSINSTQLDAPASGATSAVNVTAGAGCGWSATSEVGWITVASGGSGAGNGTVTITVAANAGSARTGAVTIAGHTYTVTQQPAASTPNPCSYSINSTQLSAPASGATSAVNVTAGAGCGWTATSEVGWIIVANGGSGAGNGTVTLIVGPNTGSGRTGAVTIAGHTYTVTQQPAASTPNPCSYSLNSTQLSAPASGATSAVNVTAGAGCVWTATSEVGWITVASGGNGAGNGTVTLTVAANTAAARTGIVTIAGQPYTVTQAAGSAPCSYELGANEQSVTASGGPIAVPVVAASGCGWTAASQVPWISVAQGATGSGNGSVQLSIAVNSAAQRVGTVTIAGQTFTVTQAAAACSYTINPTTQTVSLLGGTFSVAITTQAWCTWTATADDSWIQITSAATGVGNGTMTYNVPLVSLGLLFSRTGTITISGRVLTVNQRALLSNER